MRKTKIREYYDEDIKEIVWEIPYKNSLLRVYPNDYQNSPERESLLSFEQPSRFSLVFVALAGTNILTVFGSFSLSDGQTSLGVFLLVCAVILALSCGFFILGGAKDTANQALQLGKQLAFRDLPSHFTEDPEAFELLKQVMEKSKQKNT